MEDFIDRITNPSIWLVGIIASVAGGFLVKAVYPHFQNALSRASSRYRRRRERKEREYQADVALLASSGQYMSALINKCKNSAELGIALGLTSLIMLDFATLKRADSKIDALSKNIAYLVTRVSPSTEEERHEKKMLAVEVTKLSKRSWSNKGVVLVA